jgi:AraC family transcriptional regulator
MKRRSSPVSFGSPRFSTVEAGAFLVTDAWFPPDAFLPRHYHDRTVMGITVAGWGTSILGRRELSLQPGTLHTEPGGDAHSNRFGPSGARVVVVQPDPRAVDLVESVAPLLTHVHRVTAPDVVGLALRLRTEIGRPDKLTPLAIEGACLELLAAGSRAAGDRALYPSTRSSWLPRVVEYLREHFLDCPTIAELSRVAGVHPTHFARTFRAAVHQSPAAYVRRLRLDWAADVLARTDQPLVDVAAATGFADQSHFTRAFRRHTGVTPAAYRQGLGREHSAR